ncbi:MAG: four-carbon acid sugar kinase family protein [Bryobacteraceae bacterium]
MTAALPSRVISWYGDDFTGSTDALEALAPHMPSVLFLRRPDDASFAPFADYAAFGLAGSSRSETPEWMDANLPATFAWLESLGTEVCHYKVCSTFDSAPGMGNIGRALEIGRRVFGGASAPIVVGAPPLGRYTFFGNLFARAGDTIHRIDRHPTMRCHPVTPMGEADLRLHLAAQTTLDIGLLDAVQLESSGAAERYRNLRQSCQAVLIDVMNQATLAQAGSLLWGADRARFIVGSSGVEYALLAHWGLERPAAIAAEPVDRIVVLSGSCSPVTASQIEFAHRSEAFAPVRLDARALTSAGASGAAEQACRSALESLRQGRSPVLYTAATPEDRIEDFQARQSLGEQAGRILARVLDQSGVRRAVIAGGDTSSHGGQQLGIDALTFVAHLAPGAPLCRAWSRDPRRRDLEIVFKGGQCGREDFFELVRKGRN